MKRLFWLGLGAAAGYYAARRGDEVVERARERGLVGNVTLAASTAQRVAGTATRTAAVLGDRARAFTADAGAAPAPGAAPSAPAAPSPATPTNDAREARP